MVDLQGVSPPASSLHSSLSTPMFRPQTMGQKTILAPSGAGGGLQTSTYRPRHGNQQEVAKMTPSSYPNPDSPVIKKKMLLTKVSVYRHNLCHMEMANLYPFPSVNETLVGPTIDSGVVDTIFVGATLVDEGHSDASGRGRRILRCKRQCDRKDGSSNVEGGENDPARLQAESQRLRDEVPKLQSAVAQCDSTLGYQRRVRSRSRSSSPGTVRTMR
ncbi:hypothetical protein Plhal703r1_c47g0149881 [Plasmopara halstedii]